jgi:hypothetical protein
MALTRKGVFKVARIGIFAPMILQAAIAPTAQPHRAARPVRFALLGLLLLSRL